MKEYTLSGRQTNLYGLLFCIPVLLLAVIPYIFIWCNVREGWPDGLLPLIYRNYGLAQLLINPQWWMPLVLFLCLLLLLLTGVVLHELIHGVCMALFAKNGWKSVSFGFNVKAIAPYTHCRELLSPAAYRLSLVMPGILLGDIQILISWGTGNILFLFFGIIFCCAAAGDIVVLWLTRDITDGMLQDHPEKIGFVHVEEYEI